MIRISTLLAALLFAPLANAGKPSPPTDLLNGSNWSFWFGAWMPGYLQTGETHATNLVSQPGWFFDFPVLSGDMSQCWSSASACAQVDYLLAGWTQPLTSKSYAQFTVTIATTGSPVFNYQTESNNTCVYPAHVRLLVWSCAESCSRKTLVGLDPYGRWWSNPVAVLLAPGSATIQVPIDPSQWTSVYGERGTDSADALAGWMATFGAPGRVGLTFGGGCFFGHGVNVSGGTARFIVTDYSFH